MGLSIIILVREIMVIRLLCFGVVSVFCNCWSFVIVLLMLSWLLLIFIIVVICGWFKLIFKCCVYFISVGVFFLVWIRFIISFLCKWLFCVKRCINCDCFSIILVVIYISLLYLCRCFGLLVRLIMLIILFLRCKGRLIFWCILCRCCVMVLLIFIIWFCDSINSVFLCNLLICFWLLLLIICLWVFIMLILVLMMCIVCVMIFCVILVLRC